MLRGGASPEYLPGVVVCGLLGGAVVDDGADLGGGLAFVGRAEDIDEDGSRPRYTEDSSMTTTVYHAHDRYGELLYVGISNNINERLTEHKSRSCWWPDTARITVMDFDSRSDAETAEAADIRALHPTRNRKQPNADIRTTPRDIIHQAIAIDSREAMEIAADARALMIYELATSVGNAEAARRLGVTHLVIAKSTRRARNIRTDAGRLARARRFAGQPTTPQQLLAVARAIDPIEIRNAAADARALRIVATIGGGNEVGVRRVLGSTAVWEARTRAQEVLANPTRHDRAIDVASRVVDDRKERDTPC